MATMADDPPLVVGRFVSFESSSSWVTLRRFLKALKASFNSFLVGGVGSDGVGSAIGVSSLGEERVGSHYFVDFVKHQKTTEKRRLPPPFLLGAARLPGADSTIVRATSATQMPWHRPWD